MNKFMRTGAAAGGMVSGAADSYRPETLACAGKIRDHGHPLRR